MPPAERVVEAVRVVAVERVAVALDELPAERLVLYVAALLLALRALPLVLRVLPLAPRVLTPVLRELPVPALRLTAVFVLP